MEGREHRACVVSSRRRRVDVVVGKYFRDRIFFSEVQRGLKVVVLASKNWGTGGASAVLGPLVVPQAGVTLIGEQIGPGDVKSRF